MDDTKLRQCILTEEDVETLQKELEKLFDWGTNNNMEFNGSKFQGIRYGQNEDIKNDTTYFTGEYNEIIERFSSLRDLGVQLQEDATFKEHIENICKKARQKCGWLFRSFYSRKPDFLKHMFNSLVLPHIDYCSQLWMSVEGQHLDKVEKVLKKIYKEASWS